MSNAATVDFDSLTEREQIDLAAKAIGIELLWPSIEDLAPRINPSFHLWSPKDDDGDNYRLAVALDIQIEHVGLSNGPTTEVNCWPRGRGDCAVSKAYGDDKQLATRLAVFEVAVMLGASFLSASSGS